MTISLAYWCVLAAALLPYLWVGIAKSATKGYDNRDPRGSVARQTNPRVHRAIAAQLNAFEAFPAFVAGVVLAQLAGVDHARIATFAVAFIVFRVLHGVFYLADRALMRSLAWVGGIVCSFGLIALAAMRIASPA